MKVIHGILSFPNVIMMEYLWNFFRKTWYFENVLLKQEKAYSYAKTEENNNFEQKPVFHSIRLARYHSEILFKFWQEYNVNHKEYVRAWN